MVHFEEVTLRFHPNSQTFQNVTVDETDTVSGVMTVLIWVKKEAFSDAVEVYSCILL